MCKEHEDLSYRLVRPPYFTHPHLDANAGFLGSGLITSFGLPVTGVADVATNVPAIGSPVSDCRAFKLLFPGHDIHECAVAA